MPKVLVTGGSGKLGRAVVRDLVTNGYEVLNVDQVLSPDKLCPTVQIDMTDFGEVFHAISGGIDERRGPFEHVVHLAAIPAPGRHPNPKTFRNNVPATYNVFESCRLAGIKSVVFASSETVLGLPFDKPPPYVPVDEEYFPRPETAYSLGKLLDETMAAQYARWDPELKIIGLMFSNVMYPEDYQRFPGFEADPRLRKWNLWGYIDARDGAQAVRRGIEAEFKGFEAFIIANADTVMNRSNDSLLAEVFPGVPTKGSYMPNGTLLSIEKARRMLGYHPQFSWREEVK
jgi:nucleoside-diphosphate-sugar epimerase